MQSPPDVAGEPPFQTQAATAHTHVACLDRRPVEFRSQERNRVAITRWRRKHVSQCKLGQRTRRSACAPSQHRHGQAPCARSTGQGHVETAAWPIGPSAHPPIAHRPSPIGPSAHCPSSVLRRARPDARRVAPDQTTPVPGSRNMRARPAGRRAPWVHTQWANQDRSSEQPRSLTSIAVDSKDHDRLDDHGDVDAVVACRGLAARPGFASSVVRSRHRGNAGFLHPLFRFHS